MTAPFIKFVKSAIVAITIWLMVVTVAVALLIVSALQLPDDHRSGMFTRWSGDQLNIGIAQGVFLITHLQNTSGGSFAELPKPLLVTSSGGVMIPASELAKLNWFVSSDAH